MRRLIFALSLLLVTLSCDDPAGPRIPSGMPTTITAASPSPIVSSLTGPADGELATAATVNVPFQDLQNDAEAFRALTYGGGFHVSVTATSNTVMTIAPLGAVVVKVAGVWNVLPHTLASTIDPLALAGGAFAASTRYYVYAAIVAGVITFSVSTTAPDAGHRYKTGDEQYQFITTFVTSSTNNLTRYIQNGQKYLYTAPTDALTLLTAGNAVVSTAVPFTVGVPSGSSFVTLRVDFVAGIANDFVGIFGVSGQTRASFTSPGPGSITILQVEIPWDVAGFNYVVGDVSSTADIQVYGFVY